MGQVTFSKLVPNIFFSVAQASAQMHSDNSIQNAIVLPGLVPGIHGNRQGMSGLSWMAGPSPRHDE